MDFYNDLESFIQAYLYFDVSPTEIVHKQPRQRSKKLDTSHQDSSEFDKVIDREFSRHIPDTLTPLHRQVIHETANLEPTNFTDATASKNFVHHVKCNRTKVKTATKEIHCPQCHFKCSDLNEMRNHQLTFHVHLTAGEFSAYLQELTHSSRK